MDDNLEASLFCRLYIFCFKQFHSYSGSVRFMIHMKNFLTLIILVGLHKSFGNYGNYNYGNYGNVSYPDYGNNLSCTYPDHYCNPTANDLIRKVEDSAVQSVEECSQLCKRWQTLKTNKHSEPVFVCCGYF